MPSCRWLLCFIVLMKMNDAKQKCRQRKNHQNMPYYRGVPYNIVQLVHTTKVRKNYSIPKLWQAIFEKEHEKRKIQKIGAQDNIFKNIFKILHMP